MRIAVAGATGNIGSRTTAALERGGHEVVRISRSL
ncbi:MAG: NAD-dependent epimerase/dehydratase family protein, partial [Pseudonocardia sp.]